MPDSSSAPGNRILGITVLADFILSEGIQSIATNLDKAGGDRGGM